jgi:hypothetical protein
MITDKDIIVDHHKVEATGDIALRARLNVCTADVVPTKIAHLYPSEVLDRSEECRRALMRRTEPQQAEAMKWLVRLMPMIRSSWNYQEYCAGHLYNAHDPRAMAMFLSGELNVGIAWEPALQRFVEEDPRHINVTAPSIEECRMKNAEFPEPETRRVPTGPAKPIRPIPEPTPVPA